MPEHRPGARGPGPVERELHIQEPSQFSCPGSRSRRFEGDCTGDQRAYQHMLDCFFFFIFILIFVILFIPTTFISSGGPVHEPINTY
ncbi:unnamed protein product [Gadus morhua 'NCC']